MQLKLLKVLKITHNERLIYFFFSDILKESTPMRCVHTSVHVFLSLFSPSLSPTYIHSLSLSSLIMHYETFDTERHANTSDTYDTSRGFLYTHTYIHKEGALTRGEN